MRTPNTLLIAALALWPAVAHAQPQTCADYHKYNCMRSTDKRFSVNGQSKSAAVQVGKETELNIIVYRGQDYRIAVCADTRILGEQLAIRLVEKVREGHEVEETVTTLEPLLDDDGNPTGATQEVRTTEKRKVFDEVEKVLWDNTEHEMAQEIEFSCTTTKRIAIKVIAPGVTDTKAKNNDRPFDIGCAGIHIEHMPTPGLGF